MDVVEDWIDDDRVNPPAAVPWLPVVASKRRVAAWTCLAAASGMALGLAAKASAAERVEPDPAAPPAHAAEAPPPERTPIEVVVTGKRKGEDPFLADRSVSVLSPKQLAESQPRTSPEALWDAPGVFVQQTNHAGGSPILRGLIGPQVLLLVDGVRLNNSVYRTGPLQYLNLVDPLSVSRIEVLRGPGSVLYGSDAMGGVVQLFPREPRDPRYMRTAEWHGATGVRYASAGKAVAAHARAELGVRGFGALAAGTLQSLGDLRGGRGVGVQRHSGYADYSALGSLSYRFDEGALRGAHTKASYLFSRLDGAGRTDKLYDKQSLQIYDNELHLVYDRWHFAIDAVDTTIELTPSFQHFFERKDTIAVADDYATPRSAKRDEVTVNTVGLDAGLETTFVPERLVLRYGGMLYRDWVGTDGQARAAWAEWAPRADLVYPDGSGYSNYGAFALLEGAPLASEGGHRLQLSGGYRLHGMAAQAPARESLPEVEFSHLGHVFMGGAQYVYQERATVALSFAQGFRAPNLQEAAMLGDSGKFFAVPNDELGPERSDTIELLGRARLWRLTASWAGYVSLLDDLLIRVPTTYQGQSEIGGKAVTRHENARSGAIWGTEAGLAIDLGRGFSARGGATYTWGERDQSVGEPVPLSRIPPWFGLAALRYDTGRPPGWRGFAESFVRWARAQQRLSPEDETDVRIPEGGTPGWWTWNVRAGLSGAHYRVVVAVENLLDVEYKVHGSGVYGAGTNAMMSYEAFF